MSKSAVDVAMVGIAVGSTAIAGVGFASPFWGLAFALGGGVAGGTIALVSQRYGAEAFDQLGRAVRSSVVVALLTLPVTAVFWAYPTRLIPLIGNDPETISLGATHLQIVGLGVPFAGLYLAFVAETAAPAAINDYRFSTGKWQVISRGYRPDAAPSDD